MAQIGRICVAVWRSKSVQERFEIQKAALDECVARRPGETAFICVIEPSSEPPDDDVRKASSKMIADHGKNLKCTACVIEGAGFRGAITRSVLSGIVFLVRNPSPVKMFESVGSASRWVQSEMPNVFLATLADQVEQVRRKLDTTERVDWKRGMSADA